MLIDGILLQGYGVASGQSTSDTRFPQGTIRLQAPYFRAQGLDLDAHFNGGWVAGTLNISIAPLTYKIINADYFLKDVKWTDAFAAENFYLIGMKVVYKDRRYKALLYQPDPATKPDHFQPPSVMEIIAETVPEIKYGDAVKLDIDPEKIEIIP